MDLENKTDHAHETIHERVAQGHGHPTAPAWFTHVALSTLLMALLSATAALMAAIAAHEALLERSQEILDFVAAETDRLEIEIIESRRAVLQGLGEIPVESQAQLEADRGEEARDIELAAEDELRVQRATSAHLVFAVAVTLLSIGITLGGMAVIARRRFLWIVGLGFGVAGAVAVVVGFMAGV